MRSVTIVVAALLICLSATVSPAAAEAGRLAFVQHDGSLKIGGRTIRLYGIYIPPTERICRTFLRPPRCAPRAVLALDRMVHGLVWCDVVHRNPDGTISAVCKVRGKDSRLGSRQDLATQLLRFGWAVALPHASFQYKTLENIARTHRRGVWAFHADSIRFR